MGDVVSCGDLSLRSMKNQPLHTADLGGLAQRIDYTRYGGDLATFGVFRVARFFLAILRSFATRNPYEGAFVLGKS